MFEKGLFFGWMLVRDGKFRHRGPVGGFEEISHRDGQGGSDSGGSNPVTATLKVNLTGTLPVSKAISGIAFTITLPANVTPALTNGDIANSVVSNSGTFVGSTLSPQVVYEATTSSAPGTLKVTLANSVSAGVTQVGEVATIALQLANGVTPTVGNFGLSSVSVIDAVLYNTISGMSVTRGVRNLTM